MSNALLDWMSEHIEALCRSIVVVILSSCFNVISEAFKFFLILLFVYGIACTIFLVFYNFDNILPASRRSSKVNQNDPLNEENQMISEDAAVLGAMLIATGSSVQYEKLNAADNDQIMGVESMSSVRAINPEINVNAQSERLNELNLNVQENKTNENE